MRNIEMRAFIFIVLTIVLTLSTYGQTSKVIKGVAIDKRGTPIPFCNVSIKGTKIQSTTNNCGEFELVTGQEDFTIVFNSGFFPSERRVRQWEIQGDDTVIFLIKGQSKVSNKECKKKIDIKARKLKVK